MSENHILEEYGITESDLMCAISAIKSQAEKAERSIGGSAPGGIKPADMFETEYKLLLLCADMGSTRCGLLIGELLQGNKVKAAQECEDNVAEAAKWWEKAATAGESRCYTNLGLLYLHKPIPGGGRSFGSMPYDPEKAFECFMKAYEMGDGKAGRHVGLCYQDGTGVEKDAGKAFLYFTRAMERHDSSATLYVADCLLDGIGTEQDISKAIEIYKELHESGGHDVTRAAYKLGCIYRDGIYAEKDTKLAEKYFQSVIETADGSTKDLLVEAQKILGIE